MKKAVKITLITLGSLLGVVTAASAVALSLIFTPARLTEIVNKITSKALTCESRFERVDLTLFSTFPDIGLKVGNMVLINPMDGAQSDTLAAIDKLVVAMNLKAFLRQDSVIVHQIKADRVAANLFIDEQGRGNYEVFASDTADKEEPSEPTPLKYMFDVEEVEITRMDATFENRQSPMTAAANNLSLKLKGGGTMEDLKAAVSICADHADYLQGTMRAAADNLSLSLKGGGNMDKLEARIAIQTEDALFQTDSLVLVTPDVPKTQKNILEAEMAVVADLENMTFQIDEGTLSLDAYSMDLDGTVALPHEGRDMQTDLRFKAEKWHVPPLLALLPKAFTSWQKGMDLDAYVSAEGTFKGTLNDSLMPLIAADVEIEDGIFAYKKALPYTFDHIAGTASAWLNLSKDSLSRVDLHSLSARTGKNRLSVKGTVEDLLGKMLMDADLDADLRLADLMPMVPESLNVTASGEAGLRLHAKASLEQVENLDLKHIKADGTLRLKNLDVDYDSITASAPALDIALQMPAKKHTSKFPELLSADIKGESLKADIPASQLEAALRQVGLSVGVSDFMDEGQPFSVAVDFDIAQIKADMDTIHADISQPHGSFVMAPDKKNESHVLYGVDYANRTLLASMGSNVNLNLAGLSIKGSADYDSARSNILKQWNPNLDIEIMRGVASVSQLPYSLQMPDFKFNYRPERCEISSANLVFGNSDFYLSGQVYGLEDWISHEGMLTGDLDFTSNYTNVDDLMEVLSGLGSDPDTLEIQRQEDNVPKEANPFIVPKDVNFTLHTNIRESVAFGNELQELAGDVTINDGTAILDQVGFVCKAARMQLTAMYKSPRPNHLFLGMDFHLLDIQIDELIDMIPYVDTLVPMLSSFNGNADFHLAAETYLFADYSPKMSTLRGAAALTGKDLVVLDSETFDKISSLLLFKKKTENRIDSLDVEMTLFRKEIEMYPFLLSMDRYQLCAAGRHTLDNAYNYHLEILHSPLPGRLAVDVKGVLPKLGFSLGKVQYAELYRPEKKGVVENQTLELKKMIRQSLEAGVRESTRTRQRSTEE